MSVTQLHSRSEEHASLIESNRSKPPLELPDAARLVDEDDANIDEVILGGVLSNFRDFGAGEGDLPLRERGFYVVDEQDLDRFTLAGAESLPEIGLDEDDIGPGDVVLVLGGMFAIVALMMRLRKNAPTLRIKWPRMPKMPKLWRRRRRASKIMSDSDFYPI